MGGTTGAAGGASEAVGAVVDPEVLEGWSRQELEAEITSLAAHVAAAECRWLVMVGEFDRRQAYLVWGQRSTAAWLNWHCALSLRAGHERVRVARALLGLPRVREAFARGELSYSKVRAITRVACPENEADLVTLARYATAAQIERICSVTDKMRRGGRGQAHVERFVRLGRDEDGSLLVWAKLPPEAGEVVVEALEAVAEGIDLETFVQGHDAETEAVMRDERSAEHTDGADPAEAEPAAADPDGYAGEPGNPEGAEGADPPEPADPWSARYADALLRMAETVLAGGAAARTDRHQVVIHADLEALSGTGEGSLELANGVTLPRSTLETLLCDCDTVPVLTVEGRPVYAGSKEATVPRRMRRQLVARDRHCRFPGCSETGFVEAHHVIWRSRGGPTELWNLLLLCRFHHRLIHHRAFHLEVVGGEHRFTTPEGEPLPDHHPPVTGDAGEIVEQNRLAALHITDDTIVGHWDGRGLDPWGVSSLAVKFARQLEECPAEHSPACERYSAAVAA